MSSTTATINVMLEPAQPNPKVGEGTIRDFVSFDDGDHDGSFTVPQNNRTFTWTLNINAQATSWAANSKIVAMVFGQNAALKTSVAVDTAFNVAGSSGGTLSTQQTWQPPLGASLASTVLFLASTSGSTVSTSTWKLEAQYNALVGQPKQSYLYRIYFYTPTIGIWYRDPEVDLSPAT